MATPQPLFLLLGAGPGIGRSLAKAFAATHHFPRIVLVSRNRSRLAAEKAAVEAAATAAGYNGLQVFTFAVDISDQDALRKVLGKVEHLGEVRCVWHNAASVRFGECLGESGEEVERDWKTNVLSLYTLAQWSIPLLLSQPKSTHTDPLPSFITTSSHLPESPHPSLTSLSMAKAGAQTLLYTLHAAHGSRIRFGLVKVCGAVSEEDPVLNPTEIARRGVEFWREGWEGGVSLEIEG